MKRTPIRKVSKKRSKLLRERKKFAASELGDRWKCEAGPLIYLTHENPNCKGRSTELHEPLMRSRGGSILDPDNTVAVCRNCHRWIHDNPTDATRLGLLESQHG